MPSVAVLASGSGSNFEAIATAVRAGGDHRVSLLVCDRGGALVLERAKRLGIESRVVSYRGKSRDEAEAELSAAIEAAGCDLVALAGYMRLLNPGFIDRRGGRIINIHPSLLPAYPGTRSIERAYAAGEPELGVTVHYVDEGMDTGAIIERVSVPRRPTLEETEAAIHAAEHELYPRVIIGMLDSY